MTREVSANEIAPFTSTIGKSIMTDDPHMGAYILTLMENVERRVFSERTGRAARRAEEEIREID